MRNIDLSPLYRSSIGFDRLFRDLYGSYNESQGPSYNVRKFSDTQYRIDIAVPGFEERDLKVEMQNGMLQISGNVPEDAAEEAEYIHHGHAPRSFTLSFRIAESIRIESAELRNGLLRVDMMRQIPESLKPKMIEIKTTS